MILRRRPGLQLLTQMVGIICFSLFFPTQLPFTFADFELNDEDDEYVTEESLFDLYELYLGSIYYKEFSDVDPSLVLGFGCVGL